ncbi:MAG: aa3-type cytochrome oxidase subunit IV [Candidatus Limnocylindrales bacterium]
MRLASAAKRLPANTPLFAAMAAFGLIVGSVYWFVSYELIGSILLVGFGGAAAVGTFMSYRDRRPARGSTPGRGVEATSVSGAGHVEPAAGEAPQWAPLGVAIGLFGVAFGLAFGPWLTIAGLLFAMASGRSWLVAEMNAARAAGRSTDTDKSRVNEKE